MRGRKSQPTETKRRKGNPGGRPLNEKDVSGGKGKPLMPKKLTEREKRLWKELVELFGSMGILDKADSKAIAAMCDAYERWQEARETLQSEGYYYESETQSGGVSIRKHPMVSVLEKAWDQLARMLPEFGMTPASRTKFGNGEGEEDELGKILKKAGLN